MSDCWDVIVIGAGMSGLGAGIRLALAGKKVLIVEQHNSIGGLNSFYLKDGIKYDVGLHALTNFIPQGTKGHPLTKLCRQLRIPYEALLLEEQRMSSIKFPDLTLNFTNDFQVFQNEIEKYFPQEKDNFLELDAIVEGFTDTALDGPHFISAREQLNRFIKDPLLKEMLLLPLFYYGSAHVNDLDWRQFTILYKSIYKEGFAHPQGGVRTLLKLLRDRFREWGGKLRVKTKVDAIIFDKEANKAMGVRLESGEVLYAHQILSSIGYRETQALCGQKNLIKEPVLTFAETISTLEESPQTFGWDKTIIFFNCSDKVDYSPAKQLLDLRSGVICVPENYGLSHKPQTTLRTTHLAGYTSWEALSKEEYSEQKQVCLKASRELALKMLGCENAISIIAEDMFTPLTIKRFTGHFNGAIYGSPEKYRDGRMGYENLFICGTDQGFLGIVGALLSGISMANYHCLQ